MNRFASVGIAALLAAAGSAFAGETMYALGSGGGLYSFDSADPGSSSFIGNISGLAEDETVLGIDVRPETGDLYAIGSGGSVYRVDTVTGSATLVGAGGVFVPDGGSFGVDFNPTVDRIRFVSDNNQNLRLNPITGGLAATDTNLTFAGSDVNNDFDPNVVGAAYENNKGDATTTRLLVLDSNLDILALQSPPNNGVLNTIGSLGVDIDGRTGFDISISGVAYMSGASDRSPNQFWTIDTATGAATLVGTIGITDVVVDITAVPTPGAGALALMGLIAAARRRR